MPSNQTGYYRFPTIHGDRVGFVCEDDLWIVPTRGGGAIRLTANLGEVKNPVLSPDGSQLAFIGRDDGDAEVYVMPATGGNAKRLTFLGANTTVAGWSADGQSIIFASNASQPFMRLAKLYSISPRGGLPELLPYGMANAIAFGPQGEVVLGRNIAEPAYWKRYRGGRVGVLWVDATGAGQFAKLLDLQGNVASPMWIGDRIYFVSDHGGIGNLYSCTPAGDDLQQHTHSRDYYVRNAATDGQRIVYHAGADLAYFDVAAGTNHPIAVEFHSPQVQRQRKFIDAGKYLEDYELHPEGHSTLITSRGQSVCFGHWEGAVTSLSRIDLGRYRLTRWLGDGSRFVAVCDRSGTETLEILSLDFDQPPIVLAGLDLGRAFTLEVSPVADQIVITNHRHELIWVDLDSRQQRVLDHSQYGRIRGARWSPDGQWVVYSCSETQYTASIKLCRVTDGEPHGLTPPRFFDYGPTFDPEGRFIYFLSVREFNPVYDSVYFDLNFPQATRPFLIALQNETPSPFIPTPKGLEENGQGAKSAAKPEATDSEPASEGDADESVTPLTIDFDGIEQRIVGFPVSEGTYRQIWGLKDKVLFSSVPIKGSLGGNWASGRPPAEAKIEIYDFSTQTCETVATKVTSFKVGRDHSTLIYRSGDRLRVCKAKAQSGKNGSQGNGNGEASTASRKTGWLDLKRVRLSVLPPQEWQQMLKEIWRLQQEHFWTPDLSGVDWQRVYDRYAPLLSRISSRSEFSDLVWEMQGELGTSHAYEFGGDYRKEPNYRLGFLGADFTYDAAANGYRISHIAQGDSWTDQASPFQQIGVNVKPGDLLLAVGGHRLSEQLSPHELLVHQADCPIQLTVAEAQGQTPRTLTVNTLRDEGQLRYREWVERNYRTVAEATGGRIGYVHIPDMGAAGYAEFHRYYFAEMAKPGLLVDVRFNRGGHVSQLILEKLARRRIGYDVSRWEQPDPYPSGSILGPMVALTNEHAGSDGDIFSHCFKLMNLGPLIGTRTWGGVIGINPKHRLVDLGLVTQPEYSFWFEDVGWGVENYGTDPDISVDISPQDWAAGNDPQLEKAIQVILDELEKNPVKLPDFSDRPQLHLP